MPRPQTLKSFLLPIFGPFPFRVIVVVKPQHKYLNLLLGGGKLIGFNGIRLETAIAIDDAGDVEFPISLSIMRYYDCICVIMCGWGMMC